jgi:hypothetical protein
VLLSFTSSSSLSGSVLLPLDTPAPPTTTWSKGKLPKGLSRKDDKVVWCDDTENNNNPKAVTCHRLSYSNIHSEKGAAGKATTKEMFQLIGSFFYF